MKHWTAHQNERGAVAVVVAISMVLLMAAAAIGVDIAKLSYERQQLQNALDAAAAAGVMKLPDDPDAAIVEAQKFASANMVAANLGPIVPKIALRCVTVLNKVTMEPDWPTVLMVCGISSHSFTKLDCSETSGICSVACTKADHCNTIVVTYDKTVDYTFGPAIGIPTGSTGAIVSAACRTYCGTVRPNPMDIVVMADRTPSMADGFSNNGYSTPKDSFKNMKAGIADMLGSMNQAQQYVAFGTIAIGAATSAAPPLSNSEAFNNVTYKCNTCTPKWTVGGKKWQFNGSWVSVPFTNKYQESSNDLYKAVRNLDYSDNSVKYPDPATGVQVSGNERTHLAAAMKGAARYLLNTDPVVNLGLPLRPKEYGTPKKVIIFETDGSPQEIFTSDPSAATTILDNNYDPGVNGDYQKGSCDNLSSIATLAKQAGIQIITIGVGAASRATCGKTASGATIYVRDVLAGSASDSTKTGKASDAYDCTLTGKADAENADGDNYFCAASSDQLKSVFLAAMGSLNLKSTLIRLSNTGSFSYS